MRATPMSFLLTPEGPLIFACRFLDVFEDTVAVSPWPASREFTHKLYQDDLPAPCWNCESRGVIGSMSACETSDVGGD